MLFFDLKIFGIYNPKVFSIILINKMRLVVAGFFLTNLLQFPGIGLFVFTVLLFLQNNFFQREKLCRLIFLNQ